jgi:DNA-binding HxlR family transcriptional regulator
MLIIRDAFRGISRFDDFHASLCMARSVLTARLRKLTEQGVLERYSEHPPRYEYHLTDKGKALHPIMVSMVQWRKAWAQAPDGPPIVLVHDACGKVTHPVLTCPHCDTEVSAANAHSEPAPGRRTRPAPAVVSPA